MIIVAGLYSAAAVRPQGWWAYPLLLAAFALVVAVLPSLPTSPLGQRTRQTAYAGLVLLQLVALLLTASRGPLAGLVIALAVVATVGAWRARHWGRLALVLGPALVAGWGLLALIAPASPLRPLADTVPCSSGWRGCVRTTPARVLVWQTATEALTNPALMAPRATPEAARDSWWATVRRASSIY